MTLPRGNEGPSFLSLLICSRAHSSGNHGLTGRSTLFSALLTVTMLLSCCHLRPLGLEKLPWKSWDHRRADGRDRSEDRHQRGSTWALLRKPAGWAQGWGARSGQRIQPPNISIELDKIVRNNCVSVLAMDQGQKSGHFLMKNS